jgi:tetratricopeptide (TPR) repeat protein
MTRGTPLDSWKEIAAYLGRSVRTCRMWERKMGLPVHRLDGSPKARVFAYPEELNRWFDERRHKHELPARPPRWKKLAIRAAAVIALAVVLAVALWIVPGPPGKKGPPASAKPSLAVLYFENVSHDESLDYLRTGFPELLITGLGQSRMIRVLRLSEIDDVLKGLGLENAAKFSAKEIRSIAEKARARCVLTGSFMKAQDNIVLSLYLVDPRTGETVRSLSRTAANESEIWAKIDGVIPEIKDGLGLSPGAIAGDAGKSVLWITTSSPEAFRLYIEGQRLNARGELERSIPLFKKAVEIDPEFAGARTNLAWAYHHTGRMREWMEHMDKAITLADRLSEKERLGLENNYYLQFEETCDKSLNAAYQLLTLDPGEIGIYINIQTAYMFLDEWEKLILVSDEYFKKGGRHTYGYGNCAWAFMKLGLYDDARSTLYESLKTDPQNPGTLALYAETYLQEGRPDLALSEWQKVPADYRATRSSIVQARNIQILRGDYDASLKEIAKLESLGDTVSRMNYFGGLRCLGQVEGRLADAINWCEHGIRFAQETKEAFWEVSFRLGLASLLIRLRRYEEALDQGRRAGGAAASSKDIALRREVLACQGAALLGLGRTDEARRTAAELEKLVRGGLNRKAVRFCHLLAGLIDLHEKKFSSAIDSFKQAIALLYYPHNAEFYDPLAEAYFASGDMARAREEYERITRLGMGRLHCGDIYAKAFYKLGLIAERTGDRAKAVENYRKFLDLWQAADPGLSEVRDARARLAMLVD